MKPTESRAVGPLGDRYPQDWKACRDLRMDADRAHLAPFVPDGGTNGGAPHVRRLRTLKRKKEEKVNTRNQVKLERVLGLTVASNASLATAPATGEIGFSQTSNLIQIVGVAGGTNLSA